jgi:hypothetical protein
MSQPNDDRCVSQHIFRGLGGRTKAALICGSVISTVFGPLLGSAPAATEVQGQSVNIQLRAQDASTREVLDALAAAFKLTYKLPPSIGRNVTGLYSGTLHQVLARILDGNDYIVKVSNNGVEVVILGASGATAVAATAQAMVTSSPAITPSAQAIPRRDTMAAPLAVSPPPSSVIVPASGPILPNSAPPPPLATYLSAN